MQRPRTGPLRRRLGLDAGFWHGCRPRPTYCPPLLAGVGGQLLRVTYCDGGVSVAGKSVDVQGHNVFFFTHGGFGLGKGKRFFYAGKFVLMGLYALIVYYSRYWYYDVFIASVKFDMGLSRYCICGRGC